MNPTVMHHIEKKDGHYIITDGLHTQDLGRRVTLTYLYREEAHKKQRGEFIKLGSYEQVRPVYEQQIRDLPKHSVWLHTFENIDPYYMQMMQEEPWFAGLWHEAFVLNDAKAISRIYKMRKEHPTG